jgi:glycosyltransferase involved in cell wall biosynthesis
MGAENVSCHWIGPLSDQEGFAEEGRSLVAALRQANVAVETHDIPHPRTFENISLMQRTPVYLAREVPIPCIYHRYWSAAPIFTKGTRIWRTMFETNAIPPEWVALSRQYDSLWVPSVFNLRTYSESGIPQRKIAIVPCPLPTWVPLLTKNIARPSMSSAGTFTFLSVMRWHRRKAWDILIRAFINEFARETDIRLVVRARPFDPRDPQQPVRELMNFLSDHSLRLPPNVILITHDMSVEELADLYGHADAFVLVSRGEGWGRPLMEAMLSGVRVIGSRWGGNLAFMDDDNSVLIDGKLVPVDPQAAAEWPYFAGQLWFEPQLEQLQTVMRGMICNHSEDSSRKAETVKSLLQQFSAEMIGKRMKSELDSFT